MALRPIVERLNSLPVSGGEPTTTTPMTHSLFQVRSGFAVPTGNGRSGLALEKDS